MTTRHGDQIADLVRSHVGHDLSGRSVRDEAAVMHDGDAVGDQERFRDVVGDHERREPQPVMKLAIVPGDLVARQRVERPNGSSMSIMRVRPRARGRGRRAGAGRRRDRAGCVAIGAGIETHEVQKLADARLDARRSPAEQARVIADVFRHVHVRKEPDVLKDVADAPAQHDRIKACARRSLEQHDSPLGSPSG